MKLPITLLAALFAATFLTTSRAQIVSCNAFLKGNHVEVGINWMGAYGSAVDAPAGYHPRTHYAAFYNDSACGGTLDTVTANLGFVADPNLTNWTNYFGDYFLPGYPQEGWALQVDSHIITAYTPTAYYSSVDTGLVGAISGYSSSGRIVTATWQGVFDSVLITQQTILDTGALFFTVNVTLTNLASHPRDSVCYLRNIDPDNDYYSFVTAHKTYNKVTHRMPSDPDSLAAVMATGATSGATLILVAKDTRAKSFVVDPAIPTSDYSLKQMYNEHTPFRYDTTTSFDDATIGLVFNIGHLASVDSSRDSVYGHKMSNKKRPANSNSLSFAYSFDNDLSHIKDIFPAQPLAVNNVASRKTPLLLYPNPATYACYIKGMEEGDQLEVYDINGANIVGTLSIGLTGQITRISGLAAGQYFAIVRNKQGTILLRQRFVRQ